METWKPIKGYEGLYEVSNQGRVRSSKDKTTKSKLHGERKWRQRILKQKLGKDSCCRVSLWKNKVDKTFLVHRLVAEAFIEKIEGKEYVNHIDGNRLNNFVGNLEWCDHTENNNHAFENGLMPTNQFIILENLTNGELTRFTSMSKASEYLGRNQSYIRSCIERNDYIVDHYAIYVTHMNNKYRVKFIDERLG